MRTTYLNSQKYALIGTLAAVCGGVLMVDYFQKQKVNESEHEKDSDCGCSHKKNAEARITRGQEVYQSEMNQDVSGSAGDLNRLNPVEVGGAEDVYGAEGFDTQYVNMNPMDYQTPTAFSNYSGYASQPFWDQANDYLPEYRFAMPWSSSYLPVDAYRPQDYQGYPAGPLPYDMRTRSMSYTTYQRS